MAVAQVLLYRNATSSDATYSNSYNSKQNFPSATDLNWSVDDKVLIEWNTARDGSGSGYSVGSSINAAVNDNQGATIYYAIWGTVDVIITYQGAQIATMSDTGTKTLLTSETFCEDNIVISYTAPTPSLQSKSASYTPSETAQSGTITPDPGYDGLDEVSVSVGAISPSYVGSGVTRIGSHTYTPTTTNQVINAGQYINGVQTILGDANLIAGNIKKDVSIFSITGTYEGQSYPSATGVSF